MTTNTYNHLQLYTDGSGINGQVDAAAVSPATKKAMQLYMGDETISTAFAAELQGIRLALDITLAEWERGERRTKVTIYTDNQAAIRAVGDPVGRSGAYILGEIVDRVNRLQSQPGIQIEIRWIPLHTDIPGNEAADIAAKEAAGWRANESMRAGNRAHMPIILHPLRSTLKTWIQQEAYKDWKCSWKAETRGRVAYRYTPSPTHTVLQLHENRSERQSSLLVQMRTEKIGLRDFLCHRHITEITSPICPCGEGRQTVIHLLTRCRNFYDLRRQELSGELPRMRVSVTMYAICLFSLACCIGLWCLGLCIGEGVARATIFDGVRTDML